MDKQRLLVYKRLQTHFALIESLILSHEEFPTKDLEGLAE